MNFADIFSIFIYVVMTVAQGALFLNAVSAPKLLQNWAAAYLSGQLIWLLLFLGCELVSVPSSIIIWGFGTAASIWGGVLALRDGRKFLRYVFAFILVVVVCAVSFPQAFVMAFRVPIVEWDARSIWFFHAKALWVNNGINIDYFTNQNFVSWAHLDYPLLLPVQAAVIGDIRGAWSEMAVKGYLFFNFIAYLFLLQRILVHRGWHYIVAWALAVPVMGIALPAYLNGYADNHYAMPLMLVMLLCFQSLPRDGSWALVGLLAAFALNTKNEVALYLLVGVAVWVLFLKLKDGVSLKSIRPNLYGWGILVLGLLPFMLWALFKIVHGVEGDLQLGSRFLQPISSVVLCLERAPHILWAMGVVHIQLYSQVILGVIVALYALYISQHRKNINSVELFSLEERLLWGLLLIVHLMIFSVYVLTPYDLLWHLGSSINRLILLPVFILVALLISAVERVSVVLRK